MLAPAAAAAGQCTSGACCNTTTQTFKPAGTQCRASAGVCDVAEVCTGSSATCPANGYVAAGTVCRASAGVCDVAEVCTGSSAACPANGYASSATVCRYTTAACGVSEYCTGSSATCPADQHKPAGTLCRAENVAAGCDAPEYCTGSSQVCPDNGWKPAGTVCRPAASACDAAEVCSGVTGTCPADAPAAAGTVCRAAATECDVAESCDGTSFSCPTDAKVADGTVCTDTVADCWRAKCRAGVCDQAHTARAAGYVCRAAAGECDVAETCSGTGGPCPADAFKPTATPCTDTNLADCAWAGCMNGTCWQSWDYVAAGTVCRAAAGECDVAETCSGSSTACPTDAKKANGTACTDTTPSDCYKATCQSGSCSQSTTFQPAGTVCRGASGECDLAETCSGSAGACPTDAKKANGTACTDTTTSDCYRATCQSGSCNQTAVLQPDGTSCGTNMSCAQGVCTAPGGSYVLYFHGRDMATHPSDGLIYTPGNWQHITHTYSGDARLTEPSVRSIIKSSLQTYCRAPNQCVAYCFSAGCNRLLYALDELVASGTPADRMLWIEAPASAAGGTELVRYRSKWWKHLFAKIYGNEAPIDKDLDPNDMRGARYGFIQNRAPAPMYHLAGHRDICQKVTEFGISFKICANDKLQGANGDGAVPFHSACGTATAESNLSDCCTPNHPRYTNRQVVQCATYDHNHSGMFGVGLVTATQRFGNVSSYTPVSMYSGAGVTQTGSASYDDADAKWTSPQTLYGTLNVTPADANHDGFYDTCLSCSDQGSPMCREFTIISSLYQAQNLLLCTPTVNAWMATVPTTPGGILFLDGPLGAISDLQAIVANPGGTQLTFVDTYWYPLPGGFVWEFKNGVTATLLATTQSTPDPSGKHMIWLEGNVIRIKNRAGLVFGINVNGATLLGSSQAMALGYLEPWGNRVPIYPWGSIDKLALPPTNNSIYVVANADIPVD
jgi:hypothetical protein